MPTEKEKMIKGELYEAKDPQLSAERRRARNLCRELNRSRDDEPDLRGRIVAELFGRVGEEVWIEPPFYCDYGANIILGERVYFNFNCVILDPAPVTIGSRRAVGQFTPTLQHWGEISQGKKRQSQSNHRTACFRLSRNLDFHVTGRC